VCPPAIWNSLPQDIRTIDSCDRIPLIPSIAEIAFISQSCWRYYGQNAFSFTSFTAHVSITDGRTDEETLYSAGV